MSKLTVIILAKNEEQNIVDCINSAKFADEVLIIDDFSTDKTVQIAEEANELGFIENFKPHTESTSSKRLIDFFTVAAITDVGRLKIKNT